MSGIEQIVVWHEQVETNSLNPGFQIKSSQWRTLFYVSHRLPLNIVSVFRILQKEYVRWMKHWEVINVEDKDCQKLEALVALWCSLHGQLVWKNPWKMTFFVTSRLAFKSLRTELENWSARWILIGSWQSTGQMWMELSKYFAIVL